VTEVSTRAAGHTRFVASERAPLVRLDTELGKRLSPGDRVWAKIDVQGYEDKVLAGAEGVLHQIDYFEIELSFAELYAGQRLAGQIIRTIYGLGFELDRIGRPWISDEGRLLQVDGTFVRAT
jgi:hypothetical protein